MTCVIAIDAGTTGVRTSRGRHRRSPARSSYREFPQHFPQPGWVEHDADDIWRVTIETLARRRRASSTRAGETVAAIGITNQRETVVVWDRAPAGPGTGRSSGRTGAPRRAATSCAPRATSR